MSILTLEPSNTLSSPSASLQRPNRFILFSDSWLNLQNYITVCLQLPINVGDFAAKYGDFADKNLIDGAVDAMGKLQALTTTFGSPTLLKQKLITDSTYLLTAQPPSEIYAHIVWLAMQIQNTASTFSFTFANLKELLGPDAGTEDQRASNLKEVLIGRGGLVSLAEEMKNKTAVLIGKLAGFDGSVSEANEQMRAYTGQGSAMLKAAARLVGEYTDTLADLDRQKDQAWAAWRDYTIAAVTTSVGLCAIGGLLIVMAPFTFGTSVLAGGACIAAGATAAGVLGHAAKDQRDLYNKLIDDIKDAERKKQKKVQLVTDLTSFDSQIQLVGQGITDFKTNLSVIEGVWTDIGGKLAYICNNYTPEQLSNYSWVTQAFKIGDAQSKWIKIADTSQEFTQNSLVDYQVRKFGERIPEPPALAA
jgi:hypothetical protein